MKGAGRVVEGSAVGEFGLLVSGVWALAEIA